MTSNIYRRKPKGQVGILSFLIILIFYILNCTLYIPSALAIYDPLSVPNNKFGIHIISATPEEIDPASNLVNSSGGDWGYVTVLIEAQNRDESKWRKVFDDFREKHLIPLVRIASEPDGNNWKRPYDKEEIAWADFLDNLNWPTKNRYVIIYNEPNQAHEWGGQIDPADYAKTLDKTITALKAKNPDFFVINAGFDASAPNKPPNFEEEANFLQQMNDSVPGIFEKLDGFSSHSYPNPSFAGLPTDTGKGTVRTWAWEQEILKGLGVKKQLPIFITETGWKHAEGVDYDKSLPDSDAISSYFQEAFKNAWNDKQIVAVTPFVLSYQEAPFDHFSFKKITGEKQVEKIVSLGSQVLGVSYPEYYPQFDSIKNLSKQTGDPIQINKAQLIKGEIYPSIVAEENYTISFTFKNIGESIWNDGSLVKLIVLKGKQELSINNQEVPKNFKVKPGEEYTFHLNIKAPADGKYDVSLNLFSGENQFENEPIEFSTQVKSPVILQIKASLKWKNNPAGNYLLTIAGLTKDLIKTITLNSTGNSEKQEVKYIPPDLSYDFTLEKPFYKPKTIHQTVTSGENTLDFGELQPDISSAMLHPQELWKLLPWSN
ncbi:cellulase family glycosylhydrolase [Candidatus Daviesbacteria bacterium]|nr:cellulase family glycosylhydrolase [Candidatus Daviesbacteria bacterium]